MGRDTSSMPSRASQYLLIVMAITALWMYCLWTLNYFPPATRFFIQIFPLWLAVTVGALTLGNIGYHLASFHDCDDAYEELQQQIAMAKKDLAAQGMA